MESEDSLLSQSRNRGARLRQVAKLLRISSFVLMFAGLFILMAGVVDGDILLGFAASLGSIAVVGLGVVAHTMADRLEKTARRHLALSASQAMIQDPRPPVLYLRSFSDEPHTQRVKLNRRFWERDFAEEELLVPEIAKVGPFVAVGRPGDRLPQVGANRLYVNDVDWTSVVLRLMDEAAGVIIRIGPGGGLAWEIRQAVLRISPERLGFMIPHDVNAYSFFKSQTDPLLPQPLPRYPNAPRRQYQPIPILGQRQEPSPPQGFHLLGYLHFAPNWSPQLEFFRFPASGSRSEKAIRKEFSRCLAPFISRLMVTAPPSGPRTHEQVGVYRFNPPPNWPSPPTGWSPPPGWRPDPSWPPPPEDWNFWRNCDPNAGDHSLTAGSTPQPEQTAPIEPSGPSLRPIATGPVDLTSVPNLGPVRRILSILWALLPTLSLGLLTPVLAPLPSAHAAVRLGERRLWFFSAAYGLASLTLWILWVMAIEKSWTPADGIFYASLLALGVLATIHAFRLRRRIYAPPSLLIASAPRPMRPVRESGRRRRM